MLPPLSLLIQLEALLTIDAVAVLIRALTSLLAVEPDIFHGTFRRGQVYNNETRGIQCKSESPIPWVHGRTIMRHLKRVIQCYRFQH